MAVERFRPCENIVQLAKELNVPTQTLYRWNAEAEREFGAEFATEKSRESRLRREVRHLKRLLADFFNGVLQKVEARRARPARLAGQHLRLHPGCDVACKAA
jgi:transposase-like protein